MGLSTSTENNIYVKMKSVDYDLYAIKIRLIPQEVVWMNSVFLFLNSFCFTYMTQGICITPWKTRLGKLTDCVKQLCWEKNYSSAD